MPTGEKREEKTRPFKSNYGYFSGSTRLGHGLELHDIVHYPHDDYHITSRQEALLGRVEAVRTPAVGDGDDRDPLHVEDGRVGQALPPERRIIGNPDLLHPHGLVMAPEHRVQKTDDRRPDHLGGHPESPDEIGHDHTVGSDLPEFTFGLLVDDLGDDLERRIEPAGRNHDEQVVGVGMQCRQQTRRSADIRFQEHRIVGGVPLDIQDPLIAELLDPLRISVDNDETPTGLFQFVYDISSCGAHAADNEMLLQRRDCSGHFASPENIGKVALHDEGGQDGKSIDEGCGTAEDEKYGEETAFEGQGMNFAVPHRGYGDHGHVEGVEQAPPLDDAVPEDTG